MNCMQRRRAAWFLLFFFGALNPPRSVRPFHLSSDWTALYGNYNTGAFVEMGWSGYMFEMESDEGCTNKVRAWKRKNFYRECMKATATAI